MVKQKVLIIDDKAENRETLGDYVMMLGLEALEAENGLLGLAEARRNNPDLILLDLAMPEMDGMQFLAERERDALVSQIPVIIITARESSEYELVECLNRGAVDFLQMPPSYEILKARIENSLQLRQQQKSEAELRDRLERLLLDVKDAEKRADRLLGSIFPQEAVRELKATNNIQSRRHEDVAVLFCDIVGFTAYCESEKADKVVRRLETLVEAQEDIAEKHEVEKVKTIGDAFMAVSGLTEPGDDALLNAVSCGLEFINLPKELQLDWQVRVGIHAGSVVSGKLGRRKFAYDLWGDTVNTAARIESEAEPGTLFVSDSVWQRISSRCRGVSQGRITLKGRTAPVELFHVEELVPLAADFRTS